MIDWKQKLNVRLPALFLLATTLFFWGFYERYEPAGPALLENLSMADATRLRGECTESNGVFHLNVDPGGSIASINFRIPDAVNHKMIRVSGRVKTDQVVGGRYPWSCARLLLIQYDQVDKWIPGHHGGFSETGTIDWTYSTDISELEEQAVHADLVIQQLGKSGYAAFDRLVAEPVRLRMSFFYWKVLFAALWAVMGVVYYRRCRLNTRRLRILILLNAAAIIFGVLMPERWIEGTAEYAREEAARMVAASDNAASAPSSSQPKPRPPAKTDPVRINQDNKAVESLHGIGHFVLFASLCFLVYLSAGLEHQHRSYFFKVAFDILLFAAVAESLQYLTLDRTPGYSDWKLNAWGMLAALGLYLPVGAWLLPRCLAKTETSRST